MQKMRSWCPWPSEGSLALGFRPSMPEETSRFEGIGSRKSHWFPAVLTAAKQPKVLVGSAWSEQSDPAKSCMAKVWQASCLEQGA